MRPWQGPSLVHFPFPKRLLKSYKMSNIRFTLIAKNVNVIYYILEQDGIGAEGAKQDPKVAAAATYTKRCGVWYSAVYQETVIAN